jgi:hypothetical protein
MVVNGKGHRKVTMLAEAEAPRMSTPETSRFVRLRVELVVEVDDEGAVTRAAVDRIADEPDISPEEKAQVEQAVTEDTAEALASLIDPFDLVVDVPGVDLAQASWSAEEIEWDPDAREWDLDEDGEDDEGEADDEDD